MFIGEGPGAEEEAHGIPFVGRSGDLLDSLIADYLMPLGRSDVYVTNIVKTRCTKVGKTGKVENRPPTKAEIDADRQELLDELAYVQPKVVVTLGAHAAEWFLGDVDMEVSHGRAYRTPYAEALLCMYHPAAALRAREMKARLRYDFEMLKLLLRGGDVPMVPVDEHPNPHYVDIINPTVCKSLTKVLRAEPFPRYLAIDTEGWRGRPWSIQWSVQPGEGYMVRVQHRECMKVLAQAIEQYGGTIVAHPILHEYDILADMGIDITAKRVVDTTILSYLLRLEPQGLKPLARRWAGMEMESYEDVTGEASERIGRAWLTDVLADVCTSSDKQIEQSAKLISRMLDKDTPIRKRWKECRAREVLEEELEIVGPMLVATLDDIPLEKAVYYGCRDADATLRIVEPLLRMVRANGVS